MVHCVSTHNLEVIGGCLVDWWIARKGWMADRISREDRLEQNVSRLKTHNQKLRDQVKELEQTLVEVRQENTELKQKLEDRELQRQELLARLYQRNVSPGEKKPLGKHHGASAFHRPTPASSAITSRLTFSLDTCPHCYGPVSAPVDQSIRYTENIRLQVKPLVTEYTVTRHWCGNCNTLVKRPDVPVIRRLGFSVMAYVLYARYRQGQPVGKIQYALKDIYGFSISEGEIVDQLREAQELFGSDYERIAEIIREAVSVHADETGWRVVGRNWWLWVFVTPEGVTKFILEDTRGGGVARDHLGTKTNRVVTSDFYPGYANVAGENQYCWVHLLRDAKKYSETLHLDLQSVYLSIIQELRKPIRIRDPIPIQEALTKIVETAYPEQQTQKLQKRLRNHHQALLTCLQYDNVSPENNLAERTIRPQVILRKIFGSCRSPAGAKTHAVNTSVLTTLTHQYANVSFFDLILPVLQERATSRL